MDHEVRVQRCQSNIQTVYSTVRHNIRKVRSTPFEMVIDLVLSYHHVVLSPGGVLKLR